MRCPHCGHTEIITDFRAPIGGSWTDEDGNIHPRLRCASCGAPIDMRTVNPSRPPKPRRDILDP